MSKNKAEFIYFDHAATTPTDPRVLEKMLPYFSENFGNPSSVYRFAQQARKAVTEARETVAEILECVPREVIFTSGGTESNNMFILGATYGFPHELGPPRPAGHRRTLAPLPFGKHIVSTKIEHDSVLKPLEYLQSRGWEVTYVDADKDGLVRPDDIAAALRPDTVFVSVMYANNEIGTIQPIAGIADVIKEYRRQLSVTNYQFPLFHTDACQAAPYLPLSVRELGVDAMTINSGKIYGPKGAGALFVREGIELTPLLFGGGQEYRKRSGTENVPGIVGFAEAFKLVQQAREKESSRLLLLRDKLINGMLKNIPHARLNGHSTKRLPNNVNISFRGLEGEAILLRLDMLGVAVSSGSACTSGSLEPSHVIRALGLGDEWTHSATRFSLGHGNTEEEVDYVLEELPKIIKELREVSPF